MHRFKWAVSALSLLMACSCASSPQLGLSNSQTAPSLQTFGKAKAPFQRDVNTLIKQFHVELAQRAPELLKLKYQAMAEAPFPFFRATAFLFYHDIRNVKALNSPVQVTLQGDFHLENMGTYRTAKGQYAYDLNDFDEAFPGPYTWDIARLGTSIHLAAEEVGLSPKDRNTHVAHFLSRYIFHVQTLLKNPAFLRQPLTEQFLTEKPADQVDDARGFQRAEFLSEYTRQGRFILDNKLRPIAPQAQQAVLQSLAQYTAQRSEGPSFFKAKDMVARIAGKGSLGRYRYWALVEGPSPNWQDDLILEIKEAIVPSAYALTQKTRNNGQRIVQSYRYFLPDPDPFLGATQIHGFEAFVREYLPKETVNLEKVNKNQEYTDFLESVALIIARAHVRSGKGQQILADAQSAQALIQRIAPFAEQYAQQVRSDHKAFR